MSEQTPQDRTLIQKLSESSHPVALLFFLSIRILSLLSYILGSLFTSNYILLFITVILLLAADFWNVKNISGRLLVGLRWWNETDSNGGSIWVFETANPDRYINPIDSKVFWIMLYLAPTAWCVLAFLAVLKFEFISLILVIIAISLTMTNAMAFTKCDKFGKANTIASDMFARVTGGIMSNINPLNLFNRG